MTTKQRSERLWLLRNFLSGGFGLTAHGWKRLDEFQKEKLHAEIIEFIGGKGVTYNDFKLLVNEAYTHA